MSQDGTWLNPVFIRIAPPEPVAEGLILRQGDVLFPNRGNRNTAIVFDQEQGAVIAGAQFFVIRPKADQISPDYLAWYLRTDQVARHFQTRRKGTYVQIIERADLADLEIPLPPLARQRVIAQIDRLAVQERQLVERITDLTGRELDRKLCYAAAMGDLAAFVEDSE